MPVKHSKRYNSAIKAADLTKEYPLNEAVEILSKFPKAKFDETIELSFRLGVDPAQGDQMVRGTTPLPNGSGKKVRVIVFTDDADKAIVAEPVGDMRDQATGRLPPQVGAEFILRPPSRGEIELVGSQDELGNATQVVIRGHVDLYAQLQTLDEITQ